MTSIMLKIYILIKTLRGMVHKIYCTLFIHSFGIEDLIIQLTNYSRLDIYV